MTALEKLMAAGIPQKMAERILNQATAEAKPKKDKKKGNFFPGMSTAKAKVDLKITVMTVCECCGAVDISERTIKAAPNSPTELKTSSMLCDKCPDYFRALTHEQLVSLALVRHHAGLMYQYPRDKSQVKFAKAMTPEEVVHYKTTNY